MSEWEYLWLDTTWVEDERSEKQNLTNISYRHVWKPDGENEQSFSSNDSLNGLGKDRWELIAAIRSETVRLIEVGPNGPIASDERTRWKSFEIYKLIFKRPTQEG